jgi:hypothetical protein
MSSMSSQQTCVKWAYLFRDEDQPDRQYLFVDLIAEGGTSVAQRVWNLEKRELRCRKVDGRRMNHPIRGPWHEINMLASLARSGQAGQSNRGPRKFTFPYHFAQVGVDMVDPETGEVGSKYVRVSYWQLYNGDTAKHLFNRYELLDVKIPPVLVASMVRQMLELLQFMYHEAQPGMFHMDFHNQNIFVHWSKGSRLPDFYLADFEYASSMDYTLQNRPKWDVSDLLKILHDLCMDDESLPQDPHIAHLIKLLMDLDVDDVLERRKWVAASRSKSGVGKVDVPDLSQVIQDAVNIETYLLSQLEGDLRRFHETALDRYDNARPLYRDTLSELTAVQPLSIHGPWYCAQVLVAEDGTPLRVLRWDARPYHRPFPDSKEQTTFAEEVLESDEEDPVIPDLFEQDLLMEDASKNFADMTDNDQDSYM